MARRPRGELEQEVLRVLQNSSDLVSVGDVAHRVDGAPAYTTVMTTLVRLWSKGALVRERRGRGFAYGLSSAPEVTGAARTARSMRRLLEAEGRRADVLARFVAELDPADEELLRQLLEDETPPPDLRER